MIAQTVESASQAIDLLNQEVDVDVVILDFQMPQINGVSLARQIRALPKFQDLPLVMLSSSSKAEIAELSQDINFVAIIPKPVQQFQLHYLLAEICSSQLIKVQQPSHSDSQDLPKLADSLPLRILLAEDMVVNQKVALLMLDSMGYRADVVSNGREVLEALSRQSYDIVLMDLQMPEMDGLTATKLICQEYSASDRPRIIAMTANAMRGDKEKCLAAGMDDYISKPIRLIELQTALQKSQPSTQKVKSQNLPNDTQVVDYQILDEFMAMTGGVPAIVVELIDLYFEESLSRLELLTQAVEKEDANTIGLIAHMLKSSSANLGAVTLSGFYQELESIGQSGVVTEASLSLQKIKQEFERVQAALQLYTKKYR